MEEDGEVGTGDVGCRVGAGVGVCNVNGVELGNESDMVDGFLFGRRIFVGARECAMDGVWIGEGGGIGKGIEMSVRDAFSGFLGFGEPFVPG